MDERTIGEHEAALCAVLELLPAGYGLVHDRKIVFANTALARLLGADGPSDLVGRSVLDFVTLEQLVELRPHTETGATYASPVPYETRCTRVDGSQLPIAVHRCRIQLARGWVTVAAVSDISERWREEQALRESEERNRLLFNNISDAVFVHEVSPDGPPGRFIEVNDVACRRLGYTRDELLGMTPLDIDAPEGAALIPMAMKRLFEHGRALWEGIHVAKDGRRIPVEIANHLFVFRGTRLALSTVRDITERKLAEEQRARLEDDLRHAQKMEAVGRLAGGVAHDFNNILTTILGHAHLLLADARASGLCQADLDEIVRAADRAAGLTRQLLAFSRKQVVEPLLVDLGVQIRALERMLARLIGDDIQLTCSFGPEPSIVKADPGQIEQVLVNLAVNARDAMPKGGHLAIQTSRVVVGPGDRESHPGVCDGAWVLLVVTDTGHGMSKETKDHAFEPFFTTKGAGLGTGLGLASVYGIVEQSGGHISVESEKGRGSTFRIYLPFAEGPVAIASEPKARDPSPLPGGQETLLLVEDEPAVRALAKRALERLGYRVIDVGNASDALEAAGSGTNDIALLVSDVVMPGMNGKQLYTSLRTMLPNLKVLFVSGYADEIIAEHDVARDGVDLLAKPYTSADLARRVRQALDRRP